MYVCHERKGSHGTTPCKGRPPAASIKKAGCPVLPGHCKSCYIEGLCHTWLSGWKGWGAHVMQPILLIKACLPAPPPLICLLSNTIHIRFLSWQRSVVLVGTSNERGKCCILHLQWKSCLFNSVVTCRGRWHWHCPVVWCGVVCCNCSSRFVCNSVKLAVTTAGNREVVQ